MRRTRTLNSFIEQRNEFGRRFVPEDKDKENKDKEEKNKKEKDEGNEDKKEKDPLPKWYSVLYHSRPDLVCTCYKNQYAPHRFLFQGSGYSETSNSSYKRQILDPKVRLSKIPEIMERITEEKLMKRAQYDKNSAMITNKLQSSALRIPIQMLFT